MAQNKAFFPLVVVILLLSISGKANQGQYFLSSHYNSANGLPQNTVRDLSLSKSGNLWIASEDGLVQFDGNSFQTFTSQNSCLRKSRIIQILQTTNDRLYALDENDFMYEITENLPATSLTQRSKSKNLGWGNYHLFSSKNLEEFHATGNLIIQENLNKLGKSPFYTLANKNIILQRCSQGLLVYNNYGKLWKTLNLPNSYENFYFINHNDLYMSTKGNSFYKIDINNGALQKMSTDHMPSANRQFIWDYKNQKSYLIEDNKLSEIKINANSIEMELVTDEIPNFPVSCIHEVPEIKTLFIGTLSNGLYIFKKKQFNILATKDKSNYFYAQAFNYAYKNTITGEQLIEFGKNNYKKILPSTIKARLNSLCVDAFHNIWFAVDDTLFSYNPYIKKVVSRSIIPFKFTYDLNVIYAQNKGSLFCANADGLYSFNNQSGFQHLAAFDFNKQGNQPYCIIKTKDSTYLIGTSNGIYSYNSISRMLSQLYLKGKIVRTLYQSTAGIILVGTYGDGIFAIKDDKIIKVPLDRYEHLKSTHAFMEDQIGFIWMSSNDGLYKMKVNNIVDIINNKNNVRPYYYKYSITDGLATNEFNGGCFPASIAIDANLWSFPSMQGLVQFNPNLMFSKVNYGKVFIRKIVLNDSALQVNNSISEINIKEKKFKLGIYLSSPNWSDNENLQIEYNLAADTSRNNWSFLNNNNAPIILQNLPGGKHVLLIRKKTLENEGIPSYNKITINVPMSFYERKGFIPLLIAALLVFSFLVHEIGSYFVIRKKKRLEILVAEKTLELQNTLLLLQEQNATIMASELALKNESELKSTLLFLLSHDIATPLRFLNRIMLRYKNENNVIQIAANDWKDIKISSINLERLLDNIVAWLKQTLHKNITPTYISFNLFEIVEEKINLFEVIALGKEISIHNTVPKDVIVHSDKFIISMALQNIIGNAVQYTKTGSVEIIFDQKDDEFQISVIDNGEGFPAKPNNTQQDLLGYGIGLKITKELLKLVDGHISIEPRKDKSGTIAKITITNQSKHI